MFKQGDKVEVLTDEYNDWSDEHPSKGDIAIFYGIENDLLVTVNGGVYTYFEKNELRLVESLGDPKSKSEMAYPQIRKTESFSLQLAGGELPIELTRGEAQQLYKKLGELL